MSRIESKLKEMGIELMPLGVPASPILHAKQYNNLVFVSGHGSSIHGKLGKELTIEDGRMAAKEAIVSCLCALKDITGDLDNVESIIKVFGMVNSAPDFIEQPKVINGATEFLLELFGEEVGGHARSAVGMSSLPHGIAVEIELIAAVREK